MLLSEQTVDRVRAEFMEMPGLQLTDQQAQRLWSLDAVTCRQILESLVEVGFLTRRANGYARLSEGPDRVHETIQA